MRALLLMLVASGALAATPSITVARRVSVEGATVRLGDVAALRGFTPEVERRLARIEIASAPGVGTGKLLPKAFLRSKLRDGGVPPGVRLKLPRRLELERKARTVSGRTLSRKVEQAVRGLMPHAPADVAELKVPRLPDLKVPAGCDLAVEFEDGETFAGPHVTATLVVQDGPKVVQSRRIDVRLDVFGKAWGVAAPVTRGETLSAGEVVEIRVPRSRIPADAVLNPEDIERAQARRPIEPDEPIRRAYLKIPPLVKRGDRVRMVARRGGIEISAQGEAVASARRGDTVQVRNLSSRKVVSGRLEAANLVVMEY